MNDIQRQYISWFLIMVLGVTYIMINSIIFLKMNQRENESNIKSLAESIDELKMLLDVNQSRIEKKIFELKKNLLTQCEQDNGSSRHKNIAKLLLLVVKMKNSLLKKEKLDDYVNAVRPLILELDDPELENALSELGGLKEVSTLHELRSSFEKIIDAINYNKSMLFQKIISNWVKIKDKNDPLMMKLVEIEELINDNDWQGITTVVGNLTHPEFKPWLNRLNSFIIAYRNISIIYRYLLQYIS